MVRASTLIVAVGFLNLGHAAHTESYAETFQSITSTIADKVSKIGYAIYKFGQPDEPAGPPPEKSRDLLEAETSTKAKSQDELAHVQVLVNRLANTKTTLTKAEDMETTNVVEKVQQGQEAKVSGERKDKDIDAKDQENSARLLEKKTHINKEPDLTTRLGAVVKRLDALEMTEQQQKLDAKKLEEVNSSTKEELQPQEATVLSPDYDVTIAGMQGSIYPNFLARKQFEMDFEKSPDGLGLNTKESYPDFLARMQFDRDFEKSQEGLDPNTKDTAMEALDDSMNEDYYGGEDEDQY